MIDCHQFTIPGTPIGKPRQTRSDKWKKRPCVLRYREWADLARECAGRLPVAESVIDLSWTAHFEPPKSWSEAKRAAAWGELHRQSPDRDNIDKAILDALYQEDKAIAMGTLKKVWGFPPRVEVNVLYQLAA
jgi:Holliday junction resolvase RusA-like endonuclease